jgi:translation initiation factor 5A
MTTYDEEFDNVDSGASLTIPISAGDVKKGGHILINGRPVKVI